jgi:penicillin-binding protein 1A
MASVSSPVPVPLPVRLPAFTRAWWLSWWHDPIRRGRAIAGAVLAVAFGGGLSYGSWTRVCAAERCPSISRLIGPSGTPQQTSKVYAADGRLISELGGERRTVLPLSEIPPFVRQAFIATEDKRFYNHHGIDYIRILGALKANVLTLGYSQGFSTITMQLARNVFPEKLTREKTLIRKLKEARIAIEIEHNFAKDTILQMYLNQIDLGAGAHGVEAAAQIYFGKSARDLNLAEAATLAAIPKAPGTYNPRLHPDRSTRRRNVVLNLMRDQGYISADECELWKAYPLVLTSRRTNYGDVAPYFIEWLRQDLEKRFGRELYEGGLRVYTTLDLDMQQSAERALLSQLDAIESGVYSPNGKFTGHETTYREYIESARSEEDHGGFTKYLQGAFIALDAKTGYIRALIGGRDFDDNKFNRATQGLRAAGSTFKPFVYSAAVRAGHPVTEILDDSPLSQPVMQKDSTPWNPKDDDDTTLGPIPMRRALYMSRNLATIKLGMQLGEQTVIGEARSYGITTPIYSAPSLHIGANAVYPLEMVSAYTAFANLGTRTEPIAILRVEDKSGHILYRNDTPRRDPVMDPAHTWLIVDMMKDVIKQGTAFTAVWKAGFTYPAAGKTGTTDTYTDAWFIGYTTDLVAGVWVGYDLPTPIMQHNAGGGRIAAPAWTTFMRDVYDRRTPPADWERPDSLITREVDWSNGYIATPFCPQTVRHWDWFYPGTEPTQSCPVHSPFGTGVTP